MAPPKKQPIKVQAAASGEYPAFSKYLFDAGRMLYNEEKSYGCQSWP